MEMDEQYGVRRASVPLRGGQESVRPASAQRYIRSRVGRSCRFVVVLSFFCWQKSIDFSNDICVFLRSAGISVAELQSIDPEVFMAFTYEACKLMPAASVNAMPPTMLALANTAQLSAFVNSPSYAVFSAQTKAAIDSLINVEN